MFYRLECQFHIKLNIKCRKFQLILQIITTQFNNAKLRPPFVNCWVAQGSRPRCAPRHPILHSNMFFYIKLFATIILSWNSLKSILWYSPKLSDPFIKNENSLLPISEPISTEKNFEQKIYFCLLKMRSIFFK